MKLYVATGFEHAKKARGVMDALRGLGQLITYDWTEMPDRVQAGWRPKTEDLEAIAAQEVMAVQEADGLVVLLPGGLGTHTELGIALGMRKPVVIFGENTRSCPFYLHSTVVYRGSPRLPAALAQLAITKLTEALRELGR